MNSLMYAVPAPPAMTDNLSPLLIFTYSTVAAGRYTEDVVAVVSRLYQQAIGDTIRITSVVAVKAAARAAVAEIDRASVDTGFIAGKLLPLSSVAICINVS
jgi:hypothetical protein